VGHRGSRSQGILDLSRLLNLKLFPDNLILLGSFLIWPSWPSFSFSGVLHKSLDVIFLNTHNLL